MATPVGVLGVAEFSWESLQRLSRTSVAARLPDAADLVTHEAWQETIAFGRPWGLPRRDERVYVRQFLIGTAGRPIVAAERRVKVFDSTWLERRFEGAPAGSLERLLAAQQRPMAVGLRSSARVLVREAPAALLVLLVLWAALIRERSTMPGRWRILAPLMKSVVVRLNGAARRNQIP